MLVEMVWRMIRWQPGYHALRKWMPVLGDASRSAAARKKAIVTSPKRGARSLPVAVASCRRPGPWRPAAGLPLS